jgi:predicted PurR-regulated permease PerM
VFFLSFPLFLSATFLCRLILSFFCRLFLLLFYLVCFLMDYEEHYTGSQRVLSKGELFFTSLEQQVRRYIDMGKENS